MAGPFSGTVAIRAMKDGDFQATIFAGTNVGLQAAIDYIGASGGKVSIGPGTLSITTSISIAQNKITVEGAGNQTILSNDHATGVDIFSVTGDNVTICDLRIEGNNGTKTFGRGIDTDGDDTTVYNITFNATPDGCVVSGSGGANVRTIVRDCRMLSPGDAGSTDGYGVLLSASSDAKIAGNYISAPRLSGVFCFNLSSRATIIGNTVVNGLDNGIRVSSDSSSVRVIGNYVASCTVDGIRADGQFCVVSGNHCLSNSNAGIRTDGTSNAVWSGNVCSANGNSGLHISNATGNTDAVAIVGNYSGSNTGAGITSNPSSTRAHTNLVISGNLLQSNTFEGIRTINASFACSAYIGDNYSVGNTVSDIDNLALTNWTYQSKKRQKANVASGATLTLPGEGFYVVTGTADITSITALPAGSIIQLQFSGTFAASGLIDGSNLKLASTLAYTPDDMISLVSNGTNWYEIARSVN